MTLNLTSCERLAFQIWFVPTEAGKTFGWSLKATGTPYACPVDAAFEAYMLSIDGRTPDDRDYFAYQVYPVLDWPLCGVIPPGDDT